LRQNVFAVGRELACLAIAGLRLRRDEHTPTGWKYVLVSHNTKMGAAKGCVLMAEHLVATGHIG
jgi:aspartate-semialdehyde dehydrogenase